MQATRRPGGQAVGARDPLGRALSSDALSVLSTREQRSRVVCRSEISCVREKGPRD